MATSIVLGCSERAHCAWQSAPTALDRYFDLLTTLVLMIVYNLELKQSESCVIIALLFNVNPTLIQVILESKWSLFPSFYVCEISSPADFSCVAVGLTHFYQFL